jgi:hypothetical protein
MALQSSVFELSINKSIDITNRHFFVTSQIIDSCLSNVRLLL